MNFILKKLGLTLWHIWGRIWKKNIGLKSRLIVPLMTIHISAWLPGPDVQISWELPHLPLLFQLNLCSTIDMTARSLACCTVYSRMGWFWPFYILNESQVYNYYIPCKGWENGKIIIFCTLTSCAECQTPWAIPGTKRHEFYIQFKI